MHQVRGHGDDPRQAGPALFRLAVHHDVGNPHKGGGDLALVRVEGTQNKADLLSKDGTTVGSQVDAPVAWLMLLKWTGKKFAVEKLTHA
ncbi:MAG: hypothetical protein IPH03_08695 [Tetrasphaera sp.]|nr:hypothetical protein [Tetrasphaera sp.]